jgi:hypothetical protein
MKECKIKASVFEDIEIEGVRFAVTAPELVAFDGTDDLAAVSCRSVTCYDELYIVAVADDGKDIPVPARLLDSPIVNGGKPWIVAIVESMCEYAAMHGLWEKADECARSGS